MANPCTADAATPEGLRKRLAVILDDLESLHAAVAHTYRTSEASFYKRFVNDMGIRGSCERITNELKRNGGEFCRVAPVYELRERLTAASAVRNHASKLGDTHTSVFHQHAVFLERNILNLCGRENARTALIEAVQKVQDKVQACEDVIGKCDELGATAARARRIEIKGSGTPQACGKLLKELGEPDVVVPPFRVPGFVARVTMLAASFSGRKSPTLAAAAAQLSAMAAKIRKQADFYNLLSVVPPGQGDIYAAHALDDEFDAEATEEKKVATDDTPRAPPTKK